MAIALSARDACGAQGTVPRPGMSAPDRAGSGRRHRRQGARHIRWGPASGQVMMAVWLCLLQPDERCP